MNGSEANGLARLSIRVTIFLHRIDRRNHLQNSRDRSQISSQTTKRTLVPLNTNWQNRRTTGFFSWVVPLIGRILKPRLCPPSDLCEQASLPFYLALNLPFILQRLIQTVSLWIDLGMGKGYWAYRYTSTRTLDHRRRPHGHSRPFCFFVEPCFCGRPVFGSLLCLKSQKQSWQSILEYACHSFWTTIDKETEEKFRSNACFFLHVHFTGIHTQCNKMPGNTTAKNISITSENVQFEWHSVSVFSDASLILVLWG